jgi:hypothetical protein
VNVSDLALGVRIALGLDPLSRCPAFDLFGTGRLEVAQLVRAVSSVLFGCGELVSDSLTDFNIIDIGAVSTLRFSAPPAPSGGPTLTVPQAATVPGGIVAGLPLQASAPFQKIFLSLDNALGFYEIDLPEPTDVIPTDVTFAAQPPRTNFDCLFTVADAQGRVGSVGVTSITIARALVEDTVSSLTTSTRGQVAELIDGITPPASGGPQAIVPGPGRIRAGTVTSFFVQAGEPFTSIILTVRDTSGYYRLDLPSPTTRVLLDLAISLAPLDDQFFILSSVGLADGRIGPSGSTRLTLIRDN